MQNEVIKVKKINRLIGKIVYSTALKAAEKEVNSACTTKFYQEKFATLHDTDILYTAENSVNEFNATFFWVNYFSFFTYRKSK